MRRPTAVAWLILLAALGRGGALQPASAGAGERDGGVSKTRDRATTEPSTGPPLEAPPREERADPLAASGLRATDGAAPGYVDDRACAICHADLAASYRQVGMAQSFYRPRRESLIEDFDAEPYYHPPSGRRYEMRRDGDGLLFRRWVEDERGGKSALFEQRVDWVLGSGHTSRTYLFQTASGELFQLPLAWYSQPGRFGMAPGYDRADHQGVTRRVRRECMFCHNGYPEVPAGADLPGAPHRFPQELPEGTGCQRCHGPGAEHSRIALRGALTAAERAALGSSIVNPGRLPPAERDSVCLQCHLQPSVAFTGVRRFGRGDYSFRPGEPLAGYILPVDPAEEGRARHDRFEINHHPYRLMQSTCWRQSDGRLSCLSCHDPHRKVPPAERADHYRAACLECHGGPDACGRDRHGDEPGAASADATDCVSCHMPRRRTEDVVQVVMTDHFIRRRPAGPELVEPLEESDPVIRAVELLPLTGGPEGAAAELYAAMAEARASTTPRTVDRLAELVRVAPPEEIAPRVDLARGQLALGRLDAAEASARWLIERAPGMAVAHEWLGLALAGQGRAADAEAALRRAVELDPLRPEGQFNLALLLLDSRPEEAAGLLERAVELRPVLVEGWYRLADARFRLGRREPARRALQRALAVDPDHAPSAAALRTFDLSLPPPG